MFKIIFCPVTAICVFLGGRMPRPQFTSNRHETGSSDLPPACSTEEACPGHDWRDHAPACGGQLRTEMDVCSLGGPARSIISLSMPNERNDTKCAPPFRAEFKQRLRAERDDELDQMIARTMAPNPTARWGVTHGGERDCRS